MYSVMEKIFRETIAPWKAFMLGGLLGLALFFGLYGIYTLNPTDISWMYGVLGTDITISNNWAFYRNSPWLWPFGFFEGIGSQPMSLVYLESGPLYAVFFKILSPVLPQTFFYLGLMQCVNFIFQGALGALIGRFFFPNLWGALLGALGFLFTLPLAQRSFYHPTLAQQWIILLALLAWLYKDRLWRAPLWLVLLPLSLYLHPYFFPIIFVVFAGVYGEDILEEFKTKKILALVSALAVLAFTGFHMYMLGIFNAGRAENGGEFGTFGAPPLSLFVPWSRPDLLDGGSPFGIWRLQNIEGMSDGNTYLGFGWLVGLALALALLLFSKEKSKGTLRGWLMFAAAVGIYIMAWGLPKGIREQEIFTFLRPLRSSNRLTWLTLYLVIIFIFTQMRDRLRGRGQVVLGLLVLMQAADMLPAFVAHRDLFKARTLPKKEAPFQDPLWQQLARDYSKIFFIPEKSADVIYTSYSWEGTDMGLLTLFAGLHKLSMSDATLGGWNKKALTEALEHEKALLDVGTPDAKTLYVFKTLPNPRPEGLYFYRLDGVLFGSPSPLEASGLEKL